MSMKAYYELKDMLCGELDKFTKKSEINAQSLDMIDKLTHSIKSLETIIAMNEQDGESEMYPYWGGRAYQNGGGMSNRRGRSNAQRRDSRGRYSNRGNYSRDEARDEMLDDLREIMQDAPDEHMKSKIQRFISEIENT